MSRNDSETPSRNYLQSRPLPRIIPHLFFFPHKIPHLLFMGAETEPFLSLKEALSLRHLPIPGGNECGNMPAVEDSPTPSQELFEFFNDFSSEMCAADDVFFCGKLRPYTTPLVRKTSKGNPGWPSSYAQSEQLDAIHLTQAKDQKERCSVAADYQKLERVSSSTAPSTLRRALGSKGCGGGDGDSLPQRVSRPKWYFLMFGSVAAPPTKMEMNDIRSRLKRRIPPAMSEASDGRQTVNAGWKLLRALSCQSHATAVITPSAIAWQADRLKSV